MILPDVEMTTESVQIKNIVFDEEVYARFEPDQDLIQRYEDNADQILESQNLIQVAENNLLIDGYHRLKAFERKFGKDKEIPVLKHHTKNRDYIELKSYASNTRHGQSNRREENRRNISRLYARGFELDQIQEELGLSKTIVYAATKKRRKEEAEERKRNIVEMYLRAWNTQQDVADEYGTPQQTVNRYINNTQNSARGKMGKDFTPFLYNIWNTPKGNDTSHFGSFPSVFMENLLYYHTEPLDIVYDPFAGAGTTVDVCKQWFRRYYCSDMQVQPGREKDIRQHTIQDGLPEDLPKPDFVFLDPPYWKQAEGKYTDEATDLGNMCLTEFNTTMETLLQRLIDWGVPRIATLIAPTQYPNENHIFEDHQFEFASVLREKYRIEMRYVIPYSTEQYNGNQVDIMKEAQQPLNIIRDMIVWISMDVHAKQAS